MNIKQAKKLIKFGIENGFSYMFVGFPGIGKTEMHWQVAKELGVKLYVLHPVTDEPVDWKGMPTIYQKNGKPKAEFVPYDSLELLLSAKEPTLVLFDDLGQVDESVQKALMQVIGAREINGKKIPDCVLINAATNGREHGAGVYGMIEPLKNRFDSIIKLEYDLDNHIEYMLNNNMPIDLISFQRFQGYEYTQDFKPSRDIVNQPTPRAIVKLGTQINKGLPDELLDEVAIGTVGREYALAYLAHRKVWQQLPAPEEIFMNPENAHVPSEHDEGGLSALYAISGMIVKNVSDVTVDAAFKYLDRMPLVFQVTTVKDLSVAKPALTKTKAFIEWATKNQDVFKLN